MRRRKFSIVTAAKAKSNFRRLRATLICTLVFFSAIIFLVQQNSDSTGKIHAEEKAPNALENALYVRQEFFGAEAFVMRPTAEARENVAQLTRQEPGNIQFLEKLAALDEKLNDFEQAEKSLIRLAELDKTKLENLAVFYDRRAEFEKEAEILCEVLSAAAPAQRPAVFGRIINLARTHDLKKYLQSDFYAQTAKENPNVYAIFEKLIDEFEEEGNYAEALKFARQAKEQFPARRSVLLEKEIGILLKMHHEKEAEAVYRTAFDPFWPETEAENFYDFLSRHDRLRAYGAELKKRFKENPADLDAGIRLALYRNNDYAYGNDEITPIILQLEQAKKDWTTEELVTVTRLLLKNNEAETASRFLYTLYAREDFKANAPLRGKILYQLFEMFSDAENQKLPLTKGDLRFYEDAAETDTSPGIMTGILSLIFSDTDPRRHLDEQEKSATKYFNRAAAYRIFLAYKKEFPNAPELAQMYLDIVRLYTATKEPEIAEAALDEFAGKYESSDDYPAAALKLAEAFAATRKTEKAREVYQKLLDHLGKQGGSLSPQKQADSQISENAETSSSDISLPENYPADNEKSNPEEKPNRNTGINIPAEEEKPQTDYYGEPPANVFHDYLDRKNERVTYAEALEKLIASLAGEKKTAEILAVYSNEIQKHPGEEWLYEQRLTWLEQTNLTGDELEVYRAALARFQSRGWQDKLARWFLRQKRETDFAEFSQGLVGKLNDAEIEDYLSQFADNKASASDFEKQLFLKLYQTAIERFPHNPVFVEKLLEFYRINKQDKARRELSARYYFEFTGARKQFLDNLAEKGELRAFLAKAENFRGGGGSEGSEDGKGNLIYELFRADASIRLSNYENAIDAYRNLNRLYPNSSEFAEKFITLARSLGEKNRAVLTEAAEMANRRANFSPSTAEYRTRSGEIYAELGLYENARREWKKLLSIASGKKETYLDTATVYWDYFQYDDARQTIRDLRTKFADESLYAFEYGAILEAQHKQPEAIAEYVKALDTGSGGSDNGEETEEKEKSQKRLISLATTDRSVSGKIDAAFQQLARKKTDSSFLALGYAELLTEIKQPQKADKVLGRFIRQSVNKIFLESVRDFYQTEDSKPGEQLALKRLSEIEESSRQIISYRLQLAKSLAENHNRNSAKLILAKLTGAFPANYGVISAAADFYYRLGFENESVRLLQNALPRSRGKYRDLLSKKLANRLTLLNRSDAAEKILLKLHDENKTDTETFRELAKLCVQTGNAALLRKAFEETLSALKKSGGDKRELDAQIMDLRVQMIEAFTRLKDYKSAIAQHIEIINLDPEDEESTESAILYVQRYGGAEMLLNYYLKTAKESFKNYRWNVILARIYAAGNDSENAAKNYQAAIFNQPEMPELYGALADIETKRNNFDGALKNMDTAMELSQNAPEYVKKKIEILKKAGRAAEAEKEKAKLAGDAAPRIITDPFTEAQKLGSGEKEEARRLYREAFAKLFENPFAGELKAADISGYASSLREEEPLDKINERLWQLRAKLAQKADEANSTDAGEARKRISILDGALIESIGGIAKTAATDEELALLHADLQQRLEDVFKDGGSDRQQIISLIQNLSRKAGFGDLEEKILRAKLESPVLSNEQSIHLQNLVNFYNERGAYQKTFEALEKYRSDNSALKAETARLINNREKELEALREIYRKGDKISTAPDEWTARYLEIIYAENREELKSLTGKSSPHQLQLINFLLGKGLPELAHAAIGNANLPPVWKISRHAETSLALKEANEAAECYFCEALQIDSIGNLIRQTPDKEQRPVNDDWFRLSREYGEWLFEQRGRKPDAPDFLAAMIENQPRSAAEQFKLGEFYLDKGILKSAAGHFRIALEINPEDKAAAANLGAAYYLAGKKDWAEESWARALKDKEIKSGLILFQALQKRGLSGKAREKLPAIINNFLQNNDAGGSEDFQNLIRAIAASFSEPTEKSAYFLQILKARPTDTSLAEMLIDESLIDKAGQNEFYELLIKRTPELNGYDDDYEYASVSRRIWSKTDAESVYDQENEYQTPEPQSEHYEWQKKYLALLVEQNNTPEAARLIAEIEKELNGRHTRPAFLRLAAIQLQIRGGKFDLPQVERFIGISASDSAAEIHAPSVERFNDVRHILETENRQSESRQISESFFARMLALEQFDTANFAGLSGIFFQQGETEKARQILQLMADTGDDAKREIALAGIADFDAVKSKSADTKKLPENLKTNSINQGDALKIAAQISFEFQQAAAAIAFRRQLAEANPADLPNKIELAKLLAAAGEKEESANLLVQINDSRDALRPLRWQARMLLRKINPGTEIGNTKFDFLSQFYNGLLAEETGKNNLAEEFFINSLIDENDAEAVFPSPNAKTAVTSAQQELIRVYALSGKPFAALKLSGREKSTKSDELLQILSGAAESIGDFARAIEFEKAKLAIDENRIAHLQKLSDEKERKATNFTVNAENTRKL